jgi:hypothetical protein
MRAEARWLVPVKLATWEAKIGKMTDQAAWAKSSPDPITVASICHPKQGVEIGRIVVPSQHRQKSL